MPSNFLVHMALITANILFGGGAVIGKFGVKGTNPILFSFVRESIAGPILLYCGYLIKKETINK
jgi:drug/metabolite transporter (DMT)-like permease